MNLEAPRMDLSDTPVGYHHFCDDISINFQCNRWLQWIQVSRADEAVVHYEIAGLAQRAEGYPEWIDGFLGLAENARAAGRVFAAAYYDRAANFFMLPEDPRRPATRARFVAQMRETYGVTPVHVPFGNGYLPTYDLRPDGTQSHTILMHGGFDSFVEEFFPMIAALVDDGFRVVVFDGPGQGGALDEAGLAMTPDWGRPVGAVLDHFDLDDVTAVGVSLGGALVIRAAASESRITRVVAYDIMDDFFEAVTRQIGPGTGPVLRLMLALRATRLVNAIGRIAAARRPVSDWGLRQGMQVTGTTTPYDFIRATLGFRTAGISSDITGDVLLLAGADDHYVPLHQLPRQAAALTRARSVTTRTFTALEEASNHCQVGNIGLVTRVITAWLDQLADVPVG